MAKENYIVLQQRLKIVKACLSEELSISEICKKYGICRKTAYKWIKRFLTFGEAGLETLSNSPHNPYSKYTMDQVNKALDLKAKYRNWGPKKIIIKLQELYPDEIWFSQTRLYEIFKNHNLTRSRRIRHRVPDTGPLEDVIGCNDTWAVDIKGWFLTQDYSKCEPLTITDTFSRFLIACEHMQRHSADCVWQIFVKAFKEYGLPNRVRSDNGPPFGSTGAGRLTALSVNLIKAGVVPEWIRPGHPEENGRHERFHLTLQQEIASPPEKTLTAQIQAMNDFKDIYNFERPHEALNMKTPGSCYRKSPRSWNGLLRPPEYDTSKFEVRKVCSSGCIWLSGQEYYIGQTVSGEYVGVKYNESEDVELHYGPIYLGIINKKGFEKPKLPRRRRR